MTKLILMAALLTSTAAFGQSSGGPPEIAYAVADTRGDAIYLVNSDGSGLTKIYQGKSTSRSGSPIESIALRLRAEDPDGGGEVAFIEKERTLKVQKHGANGQPQGESYVIAMPASSSCVLHDLDYLSNGELVVADSCMNVWTVAPGATAGGSTPRFQAPVNSLAALGDDIVYVDGDVLKRRYSSGTTTTLRTLGNPFHFVDAGAGKAFLSEYTSSTFQTVDLANPYARDDGCTQAGRVEVSGDGSQMIYWYRNLLLLHASDCIGQTATRIARGVRAFAWRND